MAGDEATERGSYLSRQSHVEGFEFFSLGIGRS